MRYLPFALLLFVVGCTSEPPDGVELKGDAPLPWQSADTAVVVVDGRVAGDRVFWNESDSDQQEWLKKGGYVKDRTELDVRATELYRKRTEGTGIEEDALGNAYYVHQE